MPLVGLPPKTASWSPPDRNRRELTATVTYIKFFDEDTDTIIAAATSPEILAGSREFSIKGQVDNDGDIEQGGTYRFFGRWSNHHRYGWQFSFDTHVADRPSTRAGVLTYLVRECPGIGHVTATKLWDKYGEHTLDVLRTDPERAVKDGIMKPVNAATAGEYLKIASADEKTRIELFELFSGRGFTRNTIKACIARWGVLAADRIRRDPFVMLTSEIPGAGWVRCDKLYLDLCRRPASLKRQMLAAWHALRNTDGDTWMIHGAARKAIAAAVGFSKARFDRAIQLGLRSRWLAQRIDAAGVEWIAEWSKAENEAKLAGHVRRLCAGGGTPSRWPTLDAITAGPGAALTPHQRTALASILHSPFAILAGTPGTGKTFAAAAVLRAIVAAHGHAGVAVCAPTGKAAVRITEAMHGYGVRIEATTIHRLLEIGRNGHDGKGWGFMRNESNPLGKRFVVVDEVSMLDVDLAADLLGACGDGVHVLWVGDPGQLPPVGHGAPLRDLIAAGGLQ